MKKNACFILLLMVLLIGGIFFFEQNKEMKMTDVENQNKEFAELWTRFSNEVEQHGNLPVKTRFYVLLAANIAAQSQESYRLVLSQAVEAGVLPEEIKEVLYQTVPYAGYAKVYDFLLLTDNFFKENKIENKNVKWTTTNETTRFAEGLKVQKQIFGAENIENMRQNAPKDLSHIQDYLSANCFGDYYTRGGIDVKNRELITFATLAAMGGADAQVKAHVQANVNVGNKREILIDVITQLLPYIGYPRALNAISAINEICPN